MKIRFCCSKKNAVAGGGSNNLDIFSQQPRKTKRRWLWFGIVTLSVLLLLLVASIVTKFVHIETPIAAALGGVLAAIVTYLFNELSRNALAMHDELAVINLYKSEISDLIRHLEANAEILIQIRKNILDEGHRCVSGVHFVNLQWPDNSIIFSDDMAKLVTEGRVNDFTRLKVNIRNLNNYARWLQDLAEKGENMLGPVEWVITRHIGYITNLYYMESHHYHLPSSDALESYIRDGMFGAFPVVGRLSKLFKDYPADRQLEEVDGFIKRYFADRSSKRTVFTRP